MYYKKNAATREELGEKSKAAFLAYVETSEQKEIYAALEALDTDLHTEVMGAFMMGYIQGWRERNDAS